jgi:hypothetical protein
MRLSVEGKVRALARIYVDIPLLFLLLPLSAAAQNKTDSVTVTGQTQKTRTEILRSFVRSTVAPSYGTGKLARWTTPICPLVIGLKPEENAAVALRIRNDAQSVGALVATNEPCAANVTVAFAPDPQALMIKIAKSADRMGNIGDNDGAYHRQKLSQVVAPIQAWYGTKTTQVHGGPGARQSSYPDLNDYCQAVSCYTTEASRLGNGVPSNLSNVFVVVDLGKVDNQQVGTIADYVAMLTLLKTDAFAACRPLPSVTNLLTPDCDGSLKTAALSDADLAFLRGVYKADAGQNMNLAMGDILREMEKSPAGRNVNIPAPILSGSTASTPAAK